MKKTLVLIPALALMLTLMVSHRAEAYQITYGFNGTVDLVSADLASAFNTTQTISGSFTIETTAFGVPLDTHTAVYGSGITGISASIDGYGVTNTSGLVDVFDNHSSLNDTYNFYTGSPTAAAVNGYTPYRFIISLTDSTGAAISGLGLPTSLDQTAFDGLTWHLDFTSNPVRVVSGSITSIASVPEPTTLLLLGSGLAGLGFLRRRFKK